MLKSIELIGFKSFGKKTELVFDSQISAIVGPNGSGKSNVAEGFRFVLGEQSMKSMRSKRGEDLIWGGSPSLPRANRGAVKVVFDNTNKRLNIDFSEVVIERIVYRDGQNEYMINGSKVRLRDVSELLASAHIGSSGYHIISQGEADRVLNASPKERREMVEEALGLKLYKYKKNESERKLEETQENIEKVESLRREIAPHLRFLRKQVEKIEKAREFKEELTAKLAEYLARESAWIKQEKTHLTDEQSALTESEARITRALKAAENSYQAYQAHVQSKGGESGEEIDRIEKELANLRGLRDESVRKLGRAEGALAAVSENEAHGAQDKGRDGIPRISSEESLAFAEMVKKGIRDALAQNEVSAMRQSLDILASRITAFLEKHKEVGKIGSGHLDDATRAVRKLTSELSEAEERVRALEKELARERLKREEGREAAHNAEREVLRLKSEERAHTARKSECTRRGEVVSEREERFEEEVREGIVLLGSDVRAWERQEIPKDALLDKRGEQETRRREIERLKIKIEEYAGGNSGEIVKEFEQTKERDAFLARELDDLARSAVSLKQIIEELDAKIDEQFKLGLSKINDALEIFFAELFGGGSARLLIEKIPVASRRSRDDEGIDIEDEESFKENPEETFSGLGIAVQLPRKKVRGLEVLSGGERALTSIALIFAMSQVNPPPFLILDETDAALDEANSKRYATMVKTLAKKSQLILITHNRATMTAAGELYGVTMSEGGVSKLLSVKLEEAERVAK